MISVSTNLNYHFHEIPSRWAGRVSSGTKAGGWIYLPKKMKHLNLKITGKVQGVWYRGSTNRKARELGLSGFVQNETDGSVYAEVEGPPEKVQALVEWCRRGPELARVEKVETEEGEWKGFRGFEVRR